VIRAGNWRGRRRQNGGNPARRAWLISAENVRNVRKREHHADILGWPEKLLMEEDGRVPCPYCREAISRRAAVCPHCRKDQPAAVAAACTKRLKFIAWIVGVPLAAFAAVMVFGDMVGDSVYDGQNTRLYEAMSLY
jgi:hypothetical protein